MTTVPEWMRPPRPEGWQADDLDRLAEAPRHTELIDGALVFMMSPRLFMMSPRRAWHGRLVTALVLALTEQAPAGIEVEREMTIRSSKPMISTCRRRTTSSRSHCPKVGDGH
jgi:hypothetical protein